MRRRMTVAQYRMLGRLVRGACLRPSNYRLEHPTIGSLVRKGFVSVGVGPGDAAVWYATETGKTAYAAER